MLDSLRREKKCLQQQLQRRNQRITNTVSLINKLKKNSVLDKGAEYLISPTSLNPCHLSFLKINQKVLNEEQQISIILKT